MPVYDYECGLCGPFNDLQTADRAAEPGLCPRCGSDAPRVYATMPRLSALSAEKRTAYATNERASAAPLSVGAWKEEQARKHRDHKHGPGCGCGSHGEKKNRTLVMPDGSKTFPGARPWMISH